MNYFLKVAICWLVFYLLYRLLLEKTTFFRLNRIYLLITLLLGLALPLLRISLEASANPEQTSNWLPEVVIRAHDIVNQPFTLPTVTINAANSSSSWNVWFWLYWSGVGFCLLRFATGLIQLRLVYRRGTKQVEGNYTVVYSPEVKAPFSFMHYLFWPQALKDDELEKACMLRHEETHIQQYHSLDVLLSELIKAMCWFNPLAYRYSQAIRDVHEYLADAAVLKTTNRKQYGHLLIRQSLSGPSIALVNHFSTSQLKKRIHMMMRKKSQGYAQLRYALVLPALIGLGFLFAQLRLEAQAPTTQNSTLPPPPPMMAPGAIDKNDNKQAAHSSMATELVVVGHAIKDSIPPGEIFKVVENMPEFPGGQNELLKFLAKNIVYPAAAKKDNIEGMVVVQFIVGKDGSILSPHIVLGVGGGINEEAMRVISMMPNWKPGLQRGQNVNVQFNLPIRFKLEGQTVASKQNAAPKDVFMVVENMPEFPGGSDALLDFLAKNIHYPSVAKANGVEGMVAVQYIVETDGSISDAQVVKGIGAGCDDEALRVINSMPKWQPGLQKGQKVRVKYILPIRFKLDGRNTNQVQLGESTLKVQGFKVSPNPSNGVFNLSFQAERKTTMIEVYSLSGQRVFNQAANRFDGSYNGQIDLSKQPAGEYLIRITQDGAQYSEKVVKQ
jgi:TonB family protein